MNEPSTLPTALLPYDRALRAFHFGGRHDAVITVHSDLGEHDEMPVEVFFRDPDAFFPFEGAALEACRGRVLEIGAGTGSDALWLQEAGLTVVALDVVPAAVEIMRERGVEDARQADWRTFSRDERFDTLLMLMNGVGWTGTLDGLDRFLAWARDLVTPRGQLLLDGAPPRGDRVERDVMEWPARTGDHPGESWIRLEFDGEVGDPFQELYLDFDALARRAQAAGWYAQTIYEGEMSSFVARLTLV